jgi:hypothetical protein
MVMMHLEILLPKGSNNDSELKPMSTSEFQAKIVKSTEDSKNGKITDVKDLISEIGEWG